MLAERKTSLGLRERFGFTLNENDITRISNELGQLSMSLDSFVSNATALSSHQSRPSVDVSIRKMRKVVDQLYKTRDHALTLFNTLTRHWLAGCQHGKHNALVQLQTSYKDNSLLSKSDYGFHLLFQILDQNNKVACWKELAVSMNMDSIDPLPTSST